MVDYIIYGGVLAISFLISYFTVPLAIKFAKDKGIMI